MTAQLALVLFMLAASVVMFAINRPRMDAVALLAIVTMPFTGIITIDEALAGFSDPSVVLIAALFVIGEGLVRTGVARRLGDWLDANAGASEGRLLTLLMLSVSGLGALMSSTAVVAIFIPVVLRIAQNRRISPSRLMMPLSFAALISGMLTLVATAPNLIVNAELLRQGETGFGFFSFTPFGLPVLLLGIFYMLGARRLLASPAREPVSDGGPNLSDWISLYKLDDRERRLLVTERSSLVGQRFDDVALSALGIDVVAIESPGLTSARMFRPSGETLIKAGDVLFVDFDGAHDKIDDLQRELALAPLPLDQGKKYFSDRSQELGMVEVMLPAESRLIGHKLTDVRISSEFGLTPIGLRHGRAVVTTPLKAERLKLGDTLLLVGLWTDINRLGKFTDDVIVLNKPEEFNDVLPAPGLSSRALIVLGLVVVLMASGLLPNVQAALIGCLLMGLLGCVDFDSAYGSINWKTLVLIVGMLPFSLALERTGGVELAAHAVIYIVGTTSPHLVLGALFIMTALIGLFISNTATAVLMAPVALAIAKDLGDSPRPFAMIVALAASTAFMTPISSPVNTLVVGPGQYSFADFVKIGVPFSFIVALVSVALVPTILPIN